MPTNPEELAKRVLRREWDRLTGRERRVIEAVLARAAISRDTNAEFTQARTVGERVADDIAAFGGSWRFILLFLSFMVVWTILNTAILGPRRDAFDPYPFVFLNLMLSMLAALQAPIIMMSQNRQAERDRHQAEADYEVNLKSEIEIRRLHDKLDALREAQWAELVRLQQEQLRMLDRILRLRADANGNPKPGEID